MTNIVHTMVKLVVGTLSVVIVVVITRINKIIVRMYGMYGIYALYYKYLCNKVIDYKVYIPYILEVLFYSTPT
jgi:hypothetical protein